MSIFEKTKHCTSRIPCRYKLATIMVSATIVVYAIAVPFIVELA
ncbi:MAG: hypothetical protein WBO06_01215 [Gammaproteobacteria bacterium]